MPASRRECAWCGKSGHLVIATNVLGFVKWRCRDRAGCARRQEERGQLRLDSQPPAVLHSRPGPLGKREGHVGDEL